MNKIEITKICRDIFRKVFNNPLLEIDENSSPDTIPNWDSLQQIILLVTIEKRFDMKFSASESQNFKNAGDIISAVFNKKKIN